MSNGRIIICYKAFEGFLGLRCFSTTMLSLLRLLIVYYAAALPPTTNMKTSKKKKTLISMKQLKMTGGKKRMKSSSPRLVMEGMVVEFYCKVFLRYAFSSIEELESYSQEYKKRLDEPGEGREIPDDLAL